MIFLQKVKYLNNYKIQVTFENNETKIVDLKKYLEKNQHPQAKKLLNINNFKKVKVDCHSLTWKNINFYINPDYIYNISY